MKASTKKIKIIVERTETGFSAFAEDYPVFTTGRTVPELTDNVLEAANLYFEQEGIALNHNNLKFEIDFKQFFQHYKVINAKFLAEKIGMNPILLALICNQASPHLAFVTRIPGKVKLPADARCAGATPPVLRSLPPPRVMRTSSEGRLRTKNRETVCDCRPRITP